MNDKPIREYLWELKIVAWALFFVACLTAAVAICGLLGGCRAMPGLVQKGEPVSKPETMVETRPEVSVGEGTATVETAIKTVQETLQDLSQTQNAMKQELVKGVESIESLVQNVNSTVQNYGISPEQKELSTAYLATGAKVLVCLLSAMLGFGLLGWAMPWPEFSSKASGALFQVILFSVAVGLIAGPVVLFFVL